MRFSPALAMMCLLTNVHQPLKCILCAAADWFLCCGCGDGLKGAAAGAALALLLGVSSAVFAVLLGGSSMMSDCSESFF